MPDTSGHMASRFLASYDRPPPASLKKSVGLGANTSALTFTSLLSYPCVDLAGDYVHPGGCDFSRHRLDPVIDLEHRRDPYIRDTIVAHACEDPSDPDSLYGVKMVPLDFGNDAEPPGRHIVPIGTEYYDKSCRISMQVFAMRERGDLPASSLEFSPVPGFQKAIGWSDLEGRNACHFAKVDVHRWTVCARGVNPGAMVLEKSASAPTQVPTPLAKILTDKRVNVGGRWEPLHERIFKALAAPQPKRTTVSLAKSWNEKQHQRDHGKFTSGVAHQETSSMNDEQNDAMLDTQNESMVDDATPPDDAATADDGVAYNGVTALYNHASALEDLCGQLEADLEKTDSPELLKEGKKLCEMGRALAEKVKASGDKHDAKLESARGRGEEPAEPAEGEEPDDSADMETDDEGTYKAVRQSYKPILKALRVKRFKLADVQKAQEQAVAPQLETQQQALERIRREEPAKYAEFERELRLIEACG